MDYILSYDIRRKLVLDLQAFFLDSFQLALREDTGSDEIIT